MSVSIAEPAIGEAEHERVRAVLESGQLADGPAVREFEAAFADYCGTEHGVATANGTAALDATLRAFGIGDDDVVVTTPFSFVATANAARLCGAQPVFADVDPETYNIDPERVEATLRDLAARGAGADAIVAVHLFGRPAPLDRLAELAESYGVPLVEDAAQAHGAEHRGRRVGSVGDAACFSFYPTKNATAGEGGMVVTDRDAVAERLRRFVDHGRGPDGAHREVGHNFRLSSVAAAIGHAQLEKLDSFNRRRRENAARLTAALADVDEIATPAEPEDSTHVYHQYTVRCLDGDRAALRAHLADQGIESAVYYDRTIPDEPAYADVTAAVPVARRAAESVLSLPVHPRLTEDDVAAVAEAVRTHYA